MDLAETNRAETLPQLRNIPPVRKHSRAEPIDTTVTQLIILSIVFSLFNYIFTGVICFVVARSLLGIYLLRMNFRDFRRFDFWG